MPAVTLQVFKDRRLWQIVAFVAFVKVSLIVLAPLFANTGWFMTTVNDVWNWIHFWEKAQAGGIPYVDFTKEYPVGAGILYWLMSPFIPLSAGSGGMVLVTHAIFMAVADLVNAGLLYSILKEIAPHRATLLTLLFVLIPTALMFTPARFESYVITMVLAGYWCHRRDKPLWATFFWSVGAWLKWFPVFFIAAQEIKALSLQRDRLQWLKSLGVFVGVAAAFNLPFMALDYLKHHNVDLWAMPYVFHLHRAVSFDTVTGMVMVWFKAFYFSHLSTVLSIALMLAALIVKPRMRVEYKGALICIAALVLNRVYSPQFNLWFYPFLIIVLAQESGTRFKWLLGGLLALDLTNIIVCPISFAHVVIDKHGALNTSVWRAHDPWIYVFTYAIFLRGLLLVWLSVMLLTAPRINNDGHAIATPE